MIRIMLQMLHFKHKKGMAQMAHFSYKKGIRQNRQYLTKKRNPLVTVQTVQKTDKKEIQSYYDNFMRNTTCLTSLKPIPPTPLIDEKSL